MKDSLVQKKDGTRWLVLANSKEKVQICTVERACALLKKSRRQIYRYIEKQQLKPMMKLFGQILLNFEEVKSLKNTPLMVQPLPKCIEPLFQEYRLSDLNAGRDRYIIINRIFEFGDLNQVRWLLHRYDRKDIVSALQQHGERLLSERAFMFWTFYFNLHLVKSWRSQTKTPWQR